MKKLYLIITILLIVHYSSFGQSLLGNGTFSINGNISFTSYHDNGADNNRTVFIFNPSFDYFVVDNLSLGVTININNISFGEYNNFSWGIGPSLRYYFRAAENIRPFAGFGYSYATEDATISAEDIKYNNIILNGGIDYFLTDNVALETIFSYTFTNIKLPDEYRTFYSDSDISRRSISMGLGINIFLR